MGVEMPWKSSHITTEYNLGFLIQNWHCINYFLHIICGPLHDGCVQPKCIHTLCSITFFPKVMLFMRWCGKTWSSQTGYRWQYNKLANKDYKHTLRICNTYCFSTAAMVLQTHFNYVIHTLPGLLIFWCWCCCCFVVVGGDGSGGGSGVVVVVSCCLPIYVFTKITTYCESIGRCNFMFLPGVQN